MTNIPLLIKILRDKLKDPRVYTCVLRVKELKSYLKLHTYRKANDPNMSKLQLYMSKLQGLHVLFAGVICPFCSEHKTSNFFDILLIPKHKVVGF